MIRRAFIISFVVAALLSVSGVLAVWHYASEDTAPVEQEISTRLHAFNYDTLEMPDGEVSLLGRLSDILNQEYTTDIVTDSLSYLINETICVQWEYGAAPYVGSMDPDYAFQINELFGDIIGTEKVSFILKNEDLTGDYYNEIAMYSTSDTLDWVPDHLGIVGVYLTVFTPVFDEQKNIVGYELLCDSIHGYCPEVNYHSLDTRESFSTDHWVDELSYWHHEYPYLRPIPEPDRYHSENYHTYYYSYEGGSYPAWIEFTGKTAEQRIAEILNK